MLLHNSQVILYWMDHWFDTVIQYYNSCSIFPAILLVFILDIHFICIFIRKHCHHTIKIYCSHTNKFKQGSIPTETSFCLGIMESIINSFEITTIIFMHKAKDKTGLHKRARLLVKPWSKCQVARSLIIAISILWHRKHLGISGIITESYHCCH